MRSALFPHLRNLFVALAALGLSACGGGNTAAHNDAQIFDHQPLTGSLVSSLDELYAAPYLSDCDLKVKERSYALARKLDARKKSDQNAAIDHPAEDDSYRTVNYGTFQVREVKAAQETADHWTTYSTSIGANLDRADQLTESSPLADWAKVRDRYTFLISDDLSRAKTGRAYYTRYSDRPTIEGVLASLRYCQSTDGCFKPIFANDTEATWVSDQPHYRDILKKLAGSTDAKTSAPLLKHLIDDIEVDLEHKFRPHVNPSITRKGTVLNLPLVAGDFTPYTDVLTQYIEPIWNSATLTLHLDWRVREEPNVYKLIWDLSSITRSYVSYTEKQVHLFSNVRSKSIPHEIGHVLGFPDRYFTKWDEGRCAYTTDENSADLMSQSESGTVRPDDVNTLLSLYPAN